MAEGGQVNSVGIAIGYELDGRGVGVGIPVGKDFSSPRLLSASCPLGTVGPFTGDKASWA
jgi:hypothetical protein